MMYYLVSRANGEVGTAMDTSAVPSFISVLGYGPLGKQGWIGPRIRITSGPTLPGGATLSSTQAEAGAGQPAGGGE